MQRGIVWVVDDDSSIRWVLERALTGSGLICTAFESGNEVLDALATKTPDVLISDIRMPGIDGLALLKQIKQRHPMLPVIIMTAHSDLDAAVSAFFVANHFCRFLYVNCSVIGCYNYFHFFLRRFFHNFH